MRISEDKINKIKEEVLATLFRSSPKALFTAEVANSLARDEEFMKRLLLELEQKALISSVNKNNLGVDYKIRKRWRLTNTTFQAYQKIFSQNLYAQNINYNEKDHTFT